MFARWFPSGAPQVDELDPIDSARSLLIDRATKRAIDHGLDVPLYAERRADKMIDVTFATGITRTFSGPGEAGRQRYENEAFHHRTMSEHEIVAGIPPIPLLGWTDERLERFLDDHPNASP